MKKIFLFSALSAALASFVFVGCKKDKETKPAPVITLDQSDKTVDITTATDNIAVVVTVTAEEEIDKYEIKKKVGTSESTYLNITKFDAATSHKYTLTYTVAEQKTDLANAASVIFTFNVTDKKSQTTTKTFTVTKKVVSSTKMTFEKTNGVVWNLQGPNQGAWNLVGNTGVSASSADTEKDMKNTTATTDLGTGNGFKVEWTAGNGTLFAKANSFDYTGATVEAAQAAYNSGSATVSNPAVGDIYIAKLRGGSDYAVIKITKITLTTTDNLDNIEFSYKKK